MSSTGCSSSNQEAVISEELGDMKVHQMEDRYIEKWKNKVLEDMPFKHVVEVSNYVISFSLHFLSNFISICEVSYTRSVKKL